MLKAECTWGEGPDILLINDGEGYVLYDEPNKEGWKHGLSTRGSFDLTIEEAKNLIESLQRAVNAVDSWEISVDEYFKGLEAERSQTPPEERESLED